MNANKLYVGNLDYQVTSKELVDLFSQFGEVLEAMIVPDKRVPDKSKGYGFVTFSSDEDAAKALALNGQEFKGRKIVVQIAKPVEEKATSEPVEAEPQAVVEKPVGVAVEPKKTSVTLYENKPLETGGQNQ